MMKNVTYHDDLKRLGACDSAQDWAKNYDTLTEAWAVCERGDWMLWVLGKTDTSAPWSDERKSLVACTCECARLAWDWMPPASRSALQIMEAWTRGEVTKDAAYAARAARAAYAAYAAATASADAAARAADTAYADAAARGAARAAAYAAALKKSADIVRKHYPMPPEIKAKSRPKPGGAPVSGSIPN